MCVCGGGVQWPCAFRRQQRPASARPAQKSVSGLTDLCAGRPLSQERRGLTDLCAGRPLSQVRRGLTDLCAGFGQWAAGSLTRMAAAGRAVRGGRPVSDAAAGAWRRCGTRSG